MGESREEKKIKNVEGSKGGKEKGKEEREGEKITGNTKKYSIYIFKYVLLYWIKSTS